MQVHKNKNAPYEMVLTNKNLCERNIIPVFWSLMSFINLKSINYDKLDAVKLKVCDQKFILIRK